MSNELAPFAEVKRPSEAVARGAAALPPDRNLGRLADVADWFARRLADPTQLTRPRLVLIAGDHNGPEELFESIDLDDGVARIIAEQVGAGVRLVDVASRRGTDPEFIVVRGHASPVNGDVLTHELTMAAIDNGHRIADQEIDSGADVLIPGLVGHAHAVALGVLTAILTGLEPVDAIPLPDADIQTWSDGVTDLRDTLFRMRNGVHGAIALLTSVGGADIAALSGFIAQAAVRQTPVILDGLPAIVAAVLAHRLAPGAESWFIAAGQATTRAGRRLQDMLGLSTVADLETNSAAGAGALLVLPLVRAALAGGVRPQPEPEPEPQPAPEPVDEPSPVVLTKPTPPQPTADTGAAAMSFSYDVSDDEIDARSSYGAMTFDEPITEERDPDAYDPDLDGPRPSYGALDFDVPTTNDVDPDNHDPDAYDPDLDGPRPSYGALDFDPPIIADDPVDPPEPEPRPAVQ